MKPEPDKRNTSIVENATAVMMTGLIVLLGIAGIRYATRVTTGIRRMHAAHESLFESAEKVLDLPFDAVGEKALNRMFGESAPGAVPGDGFRLGPVRTMVSEPEGPGTGLKKVILTVPAKRGKPVPPLVLFIRRSTAPPDAS
jgi:hypothetical protein